MGEEEKEIWTIKKAGEDVLVLATHSKKAYDKVHDLYRKSEFFFYSDLDPNDPKEEEAFGLDITPEDDESNHLFTIYFVLRSST